MNNNRKDIVYKVLQAVSKSIVEENFEVILMDNKSQDGSREIFHQLGHDVSWLHYHYQDRRESLAALYNRAAKLAKGEVLVFLDSSIQIEDRGIDRFIKTELLDDVGILIPKILSDDHQPQTEGLMILRRADFVGCFGFDEASTNYWADFFEKLSEVTGKKSVHSIAYKVRTSSEKKSFKKRFFNL